MPSQKRDVVILALREHERELRNIVDEYTILQHGLDEYAPGRAVVDQMIARLAIALDRLNFRVPTLTKVIGAGMAGRKAVKLIAARERLELSQASVAAALGISQSHYSKIERGTTQPGGPIMIRAAKLMNTTVEGLFE